ncbi:hypothetical protein SAMN04489724_2681 [Algoriphagus locisalis]|uniref:Uncharacterized protein n=1 Tax=Algoriphagus locisalis TaxID=305507 RepID=A0A1I7BSW8_9BACT|nr:hypothetical protein [Algoriphagus locisalis]SFT90304.1 hypothetical protein SAMN04489724_2681 [Algoriphagus locisalis]
METVNRNSKLLLIKNLLITGIVAIIAIVLLILIMVGTIGESSSGLAIGFAIEPIQLLMIGLLIFCSLSIAYFIGPQSVLAIIQGQNGAYVGIKSLLICWSTPCVFIILLASLPDLTWSILISGGIIAIVPAVLLGPIVGLAMKKEIVK